MTSKRASRAITKQWSPRARRCHFSDGVLFRSSFTNTASSPPTYGQQGDESQESMENLEIKQRRGDRLVSARRRASKGLADGTHTTTPAPDNSSSDTKKALALADNVDSPAHERQQLVREELQTNTEHLRPGAQHVAGIGGSTTDDTRSDEMIVEIDPPIIRMDQDDLRPTNIMARAELVEEPVHAETLDVEQLVQQKLNERRRRIYCCVGSFVVSLVVVGVVTVLVVVFAARGDNGSGEGDGVNESPTQVSTNVPSSSPTFDLESNWIALIQSKSPATSFRNVTSPQRLALDWMLGDNLLSRETIHDPIRIIQRFALATIWYATGGNATWEDDGWLTPASECGWGGHLICDTNMTIQQMDMTADGLSGTLPIEIGLLSQLERLELPVNFISGTIPSEIGLLTALTLLNLDYANLRGSIPTEIGSLSSLTHLHMGSNNLEGIIPSEMGLLTSLTYLSLGVNILTGSLPMTLIKLSDRLSFLSLYNNELEGTLPSEIGRFTNLAQLAMDTNRFSGSVPFEFSNLVQLTSLYLYNNSLSGSVPSSLCRKLLVAWIDCELIECDCCSAEFGNEC